MSTTYVDGRRTPTYVDIRRRRRRDYVEVRRRRSTFVDVIPHSSMTTNVDGGAFTGFIWASMPCATTVNWKPARLVWLGPAVCDSISAEEMDEPQIDMKSIGENLWMFLLNERLYFEPYERICSKTAACELFG